MQHTLYDVFIMQRKEFLTIPEFAKEIGLSRSQVFRLVQSGKIKAERFGKLHLIPVEELNRITGEISVGDRKLIAEGVKKVMSDYGVVIRDLGDK